MKTPIRSPHWGFATDDREAGNPSAVPNLGRIVLCCNHPHHLDEWCPPESVDCIVRDDAALRSPVISSIVSPCFGFKMTILEKM